MTYGFSVNGNPNSLIYWDWEDLLSAAMQVRPKIFTPIFREQLNTDPLFAKYVLPGEQRTLFSYDCDIQEPRESLK